MYKGARICFRMSMAEKRYRDWSPAQEYLLPPSPREWLPEDHLAHFIIEVVQELDLGGVEQKIQGKDHRGERPYSPAMMVALLLYAYSTGMYSSRRIWRGTYEDVAMRMIAAGEHPHFTTINQFRLEHGESLAGLFSQGYELCRRAGLVKLGVVALDGTKVLASASKHKAMSYQRMNKDEERLRAQIAAMLAHAEQVDREEDRLYGEGQSGEELPAELRIREQRLARIRAAKAELEKEAAEDRAKTLREQAGEQERKAEQERLPGHERKRSGTRARKARQRARELAGGEEGGGGQQPELPLNRIASERTGKPKAEAQRNFTDPESRIMCRNGTFLQGYNGQLVVDGASQVIVAQGVSNQSPDQQYLVPMVQRMLGLCGRAPEVLLADNGYLSTQNIEGLQSEGIKPYIALGRDGKEAAAAAGLTAAKRRTREAMAERLSEPEGKALYARRKVIVEPVFGQIKQARGFRRFSQRGLKKVRIEWALVCLSHNLLKLFHHRVRPDPEPRLALAPAG